VTVTALAAAASVQAGTAELRFDRRQALPPEPKGGSPGSIAVYHLIYTAAPGETNDLTVSGATGTLVPSVLGVRVSDTSAPLSAGPGCRAEGAEVVCTVSGQATIERFTYDVGDGNDKVRFVNTTGNVQLGPGDDSFTGDLGASFGVSNVDGGAGADSLGGSPAGSVRATYASRSAPITATLDGVANDATAATTSGRSP